MFIPIPLEFSCLFVFLAKAGIQREPENSNGIGITFLPHEGDNHHQIVRYFNKDPQEAHLLSWERFKGPFLLVE